MLTPLVRFRQKLISFWPPVALIVLLSIVMMVSATSQVTDLYHFRLFDSSDGLRPGNITGIARDQNGFLWVLYPRSVQRFDGRNTITFRPGAQLDRLFADKAGRVWVTTPDKVLLYDQDRQTFSEVKHVPFDSTSRLGFLFQMPGDKTWLSTSKGFYEYQPSSGVFQRLLEHMPLPPPYSVRIFSHYEHTLFIGHSDKVYQYDTRTNALDSLPNPSISKLLAISADSVLVTTWSMVSYWLDFEANTVNKATLPRELQDSLSSIVNVRSSIQVGPGEYLMASREGLMKYNAVKKEFSILKLFFNGNQVSTKDYTNELVLDEDGYVWMTTIDGVGRFPLHGQTFGLLRVQQKMESLPFGIDNIRSIAEDDKGNFWLATGNGVVRWNAQLADADIFLPKEGSQTQLAYPSVRGIVFDGKYIIISGGNFGIWLLDAETEAYRRPAYASEEVRRADYNDFYDSACKLKSGDILLPGRDHVYLLKAKTYILDILEFPGSRHNANFAWQGNNGEVWISTSRGLHILDHHLRYVQEVTLPSRSKNIMGGTILKDGRLLFSVSDGLYAATYAFGNVTIEKYTSLFDQISSTTLAEDYNGVLWATTENGIYQYEPHSQKLSLFDYSDNVQGYGFNLNSVHLTSDSLLLLGGTNGLNYVNINKINQQDTSLKLYIERVIGGVNDSVSFSINEMAILSWKERSLIVHFVCPYFNNPDKVQYRYKLLGLDTEWKFIGNNQLLRFTTLSPGEYTLQLEASINRVDWTRAENTFSFRILPPFWLSWWFIALVSSGAAALLWWFVRSRNISLREKQEELEAEQAIRYFSTRMAENQTVDDLVWDVAKNCIGRLHFEDCVIYLVDEDRNMLVQKAAYGPKSTQQQNIISPIEVPIGQGITGAVAATGKTEVIHDTTMDRRYIVDDERRYSEIAVPMIANGQVLGVIDSEHSKKGFFTQRHLSMLSTIASLCAAKIVKVRAEEERSATEHELMATKQQMAEIEMQALRAQMNPHFIFNCLNSINRYIVKSDQATASLYLTRFAKLIRLILDNSNSKTVTLSNELEALKLYIEMESIRFEKQFTWTIEVADEVHPDHVYVPPLIIQPYVENAIWHGLLHKEEAGRLMIRLSRSVPALLECVIEDNGVGREKAKELKSKSASTSKSLGMKLTESRLALLSKHSDWNSSVEVNDLKNSEGQPAGTRVLLRIPVDA